MRILYQISNAREDKRLLPVLTQNGLIVDISSTLDSTLMRLKHTPYAIVLLSLDNAADAPNDIKTMRAHTTTPIMTFTPHATIAQMSQQLYTGADDVRITSHHGTPHPHEILARIYAIVSRAITPEHINEQVCIQTGNLTLNTHDKTAYIDGAPLSLTKKEWATLHVMAERIGKITPHAWLESQAGHNSRKSTGVYIHRLNKIFGVHAPQMPFIENVHDVGYRLRRLDNTGKEISTTPMPAPVSKKTRLEQNRIAHAQSFRA